MKMIHFGDTVTVREKQRGVVIGRNDVGFLLLLLEEIMIEGQYGAYQFVLGHDTPTICRLMLIEYEVPAMVVWRNTQEAFQLRSHPIENV